MPYHQDVFVKLNKKSVVNRMKLPFTSKLKVKSTMHNKSIDSKNKYIKLENLIM